MKNFHSSIPVSTALVPKSFTGSKLKLRLSNNSSEPPWPWPRPEVSSLGTSVAEEVEGPSAPRTVSADGSGFDVSRSFWLTLPPSSEAVRSSTFRSGAREVRPPAGGADLNCSAAGGDAAAVWAVSVATRGLLAAPPPSGWRSFGRRAVQISGGGCVSGKRGRCCCSAKRVRCCSGKRGR